MSSYRFTGRRMKMFSSKTIVVTAGLLCVVTGSLANAQTVATPTVTPATKPVGFVVPEWKSADGKMILRLRGRLVHDFYSVETDLGGTANDYEISSDSLRAVRFGIDGQLSRKVRFRADANLTDSQINWADVFVGYVGTKYEAYIGQQRLGTTFETLGPDVTYPLPETSLVNTAFAQSNRNFGAIVRIKGAAWQSVLAVSSGELNAGDIFGDDVIRSASLRTTYALHNKPRDVIHVGASIRVRDAQKGPLLRYATRPAATNFGRRLLDSGRLASGDATLSFEAMTMQGPFMVTAEHQILWADTARGTALLTGSYLEGCWWLTGENRNYQVGVGSVSAVRPKRSIRLGGPGAIAVVARVEQLDESDSKVGPLSGSEKAVSLGIAWLPVDFVTLRLAASQTWLDRPLASQSGTSRVVMARAQFAF